MAATRIGLLVTGSTTLADITPLRERLEAMGASVVVLVPTGGPILPVSGRYYPAAGPGARKALSQITPAEIDLLLLPDNTTGEQLAACPQVLELVRGIAMTGPLHPIPVCSHQFLTRLLDRGGRLDGLARPREAVLSGSVRGR